MCWRPLAPLLRSEVAYLVRSFQTNARIRSLTTGTFNRVVKDRIAFRLSGANSVQANPHKCESDCPRNLTNIRCCARPCQRERPTEFPPDFHNGNSGRRTPGGSTRQPKAWTVKSENREVLSFQTDKAKGLSFRTGRAGEESAFAYQEHRRAQRYGLPLQNRRSFRRTPKRKTEN